MTNINIDDELYIKLKEEYAQYPKIIFPSFKFFIEHKLIYSSKKIKGKLQFAGKIFNKVGDGE